MPFRSLLWGICSFSIWVVVVFRQNLEAIEIGDFNLNVSLSQTYYQTSQNEFLIKDSNNGTFQWTEGVVNTLRNFGQLQLGTQILVRDFGDEGNFRADLDWGYLDYAFNNQIGVRLGRMRLPYGLGNEFRDVDSARMEILFPQVINSEDFRAAAAAYQGLGLYGTFRSDHAGSLQYHTFYGNNTIHDDFFLVREAQTAFNSPSTEMTTRRLGGIQLIWNLPYEGMRLLYTHLSYKGDFNIHFIHPLLGVISDDRGLNLVIHWNTLSFDYSKGPWSFCAEYANRDNDSTYGSVLSQVTGTQEYDNSNSVSYYGTLRRQMTPKLGLYLSYGEIYGNIADDVATLSDTLKESSFGYRYDLSKELILKSQLSKMRGYRSTLNGTPSEDWFMFTTRLTLTF